MTTSATPTPTDTEPALMLSPPATEYLRFLASLPEPLRNECQSRLTGSGFSANHPIFQALADFFEKAAAKKDLTRDFIGEATLHADRSKQLLEDFQQLPPAILAQIGPQLHGLLSALTGPMEKLERTATDLQRNVEALPVLLLSKRSAPLDPKPEKWLAYMCWLVRCAFRKVSWLVDDRPAWIATGAIGLTLTAVILSYGAWNLSRYYETAYQQRLAHMEADSVENTVALNRLLGAGIALKVERNKEGRTYFLILRGAHKAAEPINSPEGLAVEVWP